VSYIRVYVDLDIVTRGLQRFKNGSYTDSTKEEMFLDETLSLPADRLTHTFIWELTSYSSGTLVKIVLSPSQKTELVKSLSCLQRICEQKILALSDRLLIEKCSFEVLAFNRILLNCPTL